MERRRRARKRTATATRLVMARWWLAMARTARGSGFIWIVPVCRRHLRGRSSGFVTTVRRHQRGGGQVGLRLYECG